MATTEAGRTPRVRDTGRERVGDAPGRDAPDLFHHFIRTRNAAPLKPVLEHNPLDLVTSTELLPRLADDPANHGA